MTIGVEGRGLEIRNRYQDRRGHNMAGPQGKIGECPRGALPGIGQLGKLDHVIP
jgi:hypothetical protein